MASKIKYALCLVIFSLTAAIRVSAQYSEQDLIEEANTLFDQGSFAEAMPLYSQLLSLNPTNPVFNYKYGATALFGDAEKKEEAVKYLKFSIGKPNVDDQSWYFLGRAYHLNYLFQDAISAYEKYRTLASKSDLEEKEVDLKIQMARSGQNLLSQIKEITVLDKKQSSADAFFRIYDLSDIGGKILVTPEELLSSEDKKRNHRSLIHFRGTGTTIYFSSYGKNGKTGLDIYRASVLPDGSYSDPVAVEGAVNTPYDEDFPYLHPDNQTFYFSSKGHGSMGGYDVYKSAFDKEVRVFSKPVNLDFAVNTPDDDLFYLADSLNEMAYFASARSSKQGQLDVYKVLVKSVPLQISLIKGTFINQIDPSKKLAKITTIDATTNKEIDVQYSDPATGEYVLSFPKGGKYKFLVEEKSSDKIHAGLVDVPSSDGVKAYLQEMELVSSSGVEKLLINNLFDQTYDGDVMALAQKMLRQRAALDVNFDPADEPEPEPETEVEKDPVLAYSDAGFGAGMSNEKILEEAESRVGELKNRRILATQLASGAASYSDEYFEEAQKGQADAEALLDEANAADGSVRQEKMYGAGLAKVKAESALRKANNSNTLKAELNEKAAEAEKEYLAEKARVDSLRGALDSGNYDSIYAGLVRERETREAIDKVEDRFEPVNDIRKDGLKAESEAQKLLDRAQKMREVEEDLNTSLITKRTQREKMKGKDLKRIEEEIVVLESDIESAKRKAERTFKQAEDAQALADDKVQEYEILAQVAEENDPSPIPGENSLSVSWSDPERKLLAESLEDLPVDKDAVATYTRQHPEVYAAMQPEELAMTFRKTYGAASEASDEIALNSGKNETVADTPTETDLPKEDEAIADNDLAVNTQSSKNETGELAVDNDLASNEESSRSDEGVLEFTDEPETISEEGIGELAEEIEKLSDDQNENSGETVPIDGDEMTEMEEGTADTEFPDTVGDATLELSETVEDAELTKADSEDVANDPNELTEVVEPIITGGTPDDIVDNSSTDGDQPITLDEVEADANSFDKEADGDTPKDLAIDYDESLPVEKRVEAEQLKIQAAEDWIAIIDESITDLESGMGGEDGAEEQLASYRELREKKMSEIGQREELISEWTANEPAGVNNMAVERATADIDTLSPSLTARLEAKIPDYSTDLSSIRSVSTINRDYLPSLSEIEISGVSAPEIAEKRIELNRKLITDIDQIISKGIETEVSEEDLIEMRRVKALEIQQDQRVMEGTAAFAPRSAEAKEYAELISFEEPEETGTGEPIAETESNYTALSPALAESLEEEYSRETVLPDYDALIEEAELTTNTQVAAAQKVKIKEDLLTGLQSEISIYKAAIDAAETPDPKLVERYSTLLKERSAMIDEVNEEKAIIEETEGSIAEAPQDLSTDSLIAALGSEVLITEGQPVGEYPAEQELADAKQTVAETLDEYVALIDDPKANVDRDELQQEIQKLESFQTELALSERKIEEMNEASTKELALSETEEPTSTDSKEIDAPMAENDPKLMDAANPVTQNEEPEVQVDKPEEVSIDPVADMDEKPVDQTNDLNAELSDVERQEILEILSISEGFVVGFDSDAAGLSGAEEAEERKLMALASLNNAYVETIEEKIDSLESVDAGTDQELREALNNEITELNALSADKQQESDRLLAEAELLALAETDSNITPVAEPIVGSDGDETDPRLAAIDIPDLSSVQYKSLNASMLKTGLEDKRDSLELLRDQFEALPKEDEQAKTDILDEMERVSTSLNSGIARSNAAEIQYYQNENMDILGNLDPDNSVNRDEIIELQKKSIELESEAANPELRKSPETQAELLAELEEVNASLVSIGQNASLNESTSEAAPSALLQVENHEKLPNKAHLTQMQSEVSADMTDARREELTAQTPELQNDLTFAKVTSKEDKKQLIGQSTKVDRIGLDLLSETPKQLNYLAATVKSDSLKRMEQRTASYAEAMQSQAIESAREADRLIKMLPNQETDGAKANIEERADKLIQEAEVLYEKSALAAQQAETIREERSDNDKKLIRLTGDLTFRERKALDDLLVSPGFRIIPSEEVAEEIDDAPVEDKAVPVAPALTTEEPNRPVEEPSVAPLADLKGNWLGMVEIIAEKDDFSDVEGSMFVEANTSVYSKNKPIPLDPVMPGGLIFQVQVGAYRNPIPQDLFGAYAPIMGQKLDNGITRYRAGLFKKYGEAILARDEIREKGYSDAFVVAYVNGEKLTGTQAQEIVAQAKAKAKESVNVDLVSGVSSDEPLAEAKTETGKDALPNAEYYNDPEAAEAAQVEIIRGLFYTVQVGVYSQPVKLAQLYNLTELNSELTSTGTIRYTTGRFDNLAAASDRKSGAKEKGVTDAFVTAYYNGKRVSLSEARGILDREGESVLSGNIGNEETSGAEPENTQGADDGTTYVVIMGTFASDVPQELADLFLENRDWGIRKIDGPGGAIYLSEGIQSLEEARKLLEECRALDIRSATIGQMRNGKITSVNIE